MLNLVLAAAAALTGVVRNQVMLLSSKHIITQHMAEVKWQKVCQYDGQKPPCTSCFHCIHHPCEFFLHSATAILLL